MGGGGARGREDKGGRLGDEKGKARNAPHKWEQREMLPYEYTSRA